MAILEPRRATAQLPTLVQRGADEPIVSYPSLDRTVTTVTPEAPTAPLVRSPGTSTAVPRMISEAVPIPGISSGANIPRSMIRSGTSEQSTLNPLVGAGLGALIGNIIHARTNQPPKQPPTQPSGGTTKPGGSQPGGGTTKPSGGGGATRPSTTPAGGTSGGASEISNPAQPGQPGYGWRYFSDGTTISPNGEYYKDGQPVWSPHPSGEFYWADRQPVDTSYLTEGQEGYGWQYFSDGTAISPEGDYYYQGELVYTPGGTDASLNIPYQDQDDSGENLVEFTDPGYYYDYLGPDVYPVADWAGDVSNIYDNYQSQYDYSDLYDYYGGGGYDFTDSYGGYEGWGGGGDYDSWYGKKGGMPTPMMKRGGIARMADGGAMDDFEQDWADVMGGGYTFDEIAAGDPSQFGYTTFVDTTSTDADAQPGGFYGRTEDVYTNPVTGEVFKDGVKIYDPNVGIEGLGARVVNTASNLMSGAGGALKAVQDFIKTNPGTSGAIAGALLSQALSQPTGGNKVNLGVDMSQFGQISPRTTTFGVGAPRFLTYEQYGTPETMPEMYGAELYRNLNVPGFNPVNRQMAAGGLASMAGGGSTYYTFGNPVDPAQNLMGMKNGGAPMAQTNNVPTIAGRNDYRHGAAVEGPGDGQSDDIPAMLADGEYVIDAETVAMLGNGSNKAGAKKLDEFRENIRSHKRNTPLNKIPPPSKSPLAYLKGKKNG